MKILIIGSTGATGIRLLKKLLDKGYCVKVIVRTTEKFTKEILEHKNISIIISTVLEMDENKLKSCVQDVNYIVSCLGHNLHFKGIFGQPRKLVADSIKRLCQAVESNNKNFSSNNPVKFILMNSTGCKNHDLKEKVSFVDSCVIALVRAILPPHTDNEKSVDYLRITIGQNHSNIEWVIIRPDNLIEDDKVTPYTIYPSPIRSIIFNAGKTSRINVADFMEKLVDDSSTWSDWKGRMPVIYNKENLKN